MALAHWMHYDLQVTQRKVATIMQELTGVQVTRGALAQDAQGSHVRVERMVLAWDG